MYLFDRLAGKPTDARKIAPKGSDVLSFGPSRIVAGIAFHLVESDTAKTVDPASCDAMVEELRERLQHSFISIDEWIAMSDSQRLEWLLKQSQIGVRMNTDGVAMLVMG
jgi:hypothetical protein